MVFVYSLSYLFILLVIALRYRCKCWTRGECSLKIKSMLEFMQYNVPKDL